jgi:tetratricopeptide (TPR) repeat protein
MKVIIVLISIILLCSCSQAHNNNINEEDNTPDSIAINYNDKGVKALMQGDYIDAEKLFLKAISIDSTYRLAYLNLVNNKWAMNEYNEATNILNSLIEKNGSDAGILFLKGASLYCEGEVQTALEVYKECEVEYKKLYLETGKTEYLLNRMYVLKFLDKTSELSDLVEAERANHKEVDPVYESLKKNSKYKFLPCSGSGNTSKTW